jgi:hypothetical protein
MMGSSHGTQMHFWNQPTLRLLCAEPLEGRWLLSGIEPPVALFYAAEAVEVLEQDFGSDDDTDVPIRVGALPQAVVAALESRYPDSEPIEAARSIEDGVLEYDVTAALRDQTIELTITKDGRIIETEKALASDDLPPAVLDWVHQNYPDASIEEASIVTADGGESYEVLIASAEQQIEATLRVQDTQSPDDALAPEPTASLANASPTVDVESSSALIHVEPELAPVESTVSQATAQAPSAAQPPSMQSIPRQASDSEELVRQSARPSFVTSIPHAISAQAIVITDALQSLASAGATALVPQVAEALSDVAQIDVAAIEQGLQRIVAEVESLAEQIVGEADARHSAASLAVLGVLLAGALLLLDSRKSGAGPIVVFNAVNSSWSWILGTARRRQPRPTSRQR